MESRLVRKNVKDHKVTWRIILDLRLRRLKIKIRKDIFIEQILNTTHTYPVIKYGVLMTEPTYTGELK